MDAVATDVERAVRLTFYSRAYELARRRIENLSLGNDRPDRAAFVRQLVAMISREMGDNGTAQRVIHWAAEDAIAGYRPATDGSHTALPSLIPVSLIECLHETHP